MEEVLRWKLLPPGFGIQVDYDLTEPMSPARQEDFRALFAAHNILVFRKQSITKEQQIRVMGYLGPILGDVRDFGLVSNVRKDGAFGKTALEYHSDNIFAPVPIVGVSLFGLEVVDDASSTLFASTVRGYRTLPSDLRERVDQLEAVHMMPYYMTERNTTAIVPKDQPNTTRSVVVKHRTTEVPMLCVCTLNTDHIVGLSRQASDDLLARIFAHLYARENVYEHVWRNGDVVIWDNMATQHARGPVDKVGPRTLQRVAIGPQGFFDQYPADTPFEDVVYVPG
jgi:taurine dioxygenase